MTAHRYGRRARVRAPDTRTWQPSTPHAEDVGAARLAEIARQNSIAAGTTLHIGVTGEDCAQNTGRANGHGKPGEREPLQDPNESAAGPRGVRAEHPGGSRGRQSRSEERRVGKEGRSRRSRDQEKKKK